MVIHTVMRPITPSPPFSMIGTARNFTLHGTICVLASTPKRISVMIFTQFTGSPTFRLFTWLVLQRRLKRLPFPIQQHSSSYSDTCHLFILCPIRYPVLRVAPLFTARLQFPKAAEFVIRHFKERIFAEPFYLPQIYTTVPRLSSLFFAAAQLPLKTRVFPRGEAPSFFFAPLPTTPPNSSSHYF